MARIVLLGATGYTGGRVADALVARGARPLLAGRDPARLASVAARCGGPPTAVADVTDAGSVRALIDRGDVLVSTVGPFVRLGAAAVTAAADAGAVYLDSAGEPPFIRRVFEEHGPRAERSGAALLTAFGCDWVPGNLAAATALDRAGGGARTVAVGYFLTGAGPRSLSAGTLRSLTELGGAPGHAYRGGRLVRERPAARLRRFDLDGASRPAVSVGGTEQFALPALDPDLLDVEVFLGWAGRASGLLRAGSRALAALGRLPGSAGAGTRLGRTLAGRLPPGPDPSAPSPVRTQVVAEVADRSGRVLGRVRLDGPEPYRLTADLLAWAAVRAARDGVAGTGALGPVAAFGLAALTEGAAGADLLPV